MIEHSPFKILYLQSTSEISGTDITLFRTLELLDRTRFEPHVIIPKEGPLTEAFMRIGCRIHILPDMRKLTRHRNIFQHICFILNYLPAVFKITKVIYREKIDLVHTNTIHNLYGFLAAKMTKKPHIWHIREIVVQSNIMRFIEKYLVQWLLLWRSQEDRTQYLGGCKKKPPNLLATCDAPQGLLIYYWGGGQVPTNTYSRGPPGSRAWALDISCH